MQGFDFETVTLKRAINMFKSMELSEYIYEGVLYYYYKIKNTREESNLDRHSSKMRGGSSLSNSNPEMDSRAGKCKK